MIKMVRCHIDISTSVRGTSGHLSRILARTRMGATCGRARRRRSDSSKDSIFSSSWAGHRMCHPWLKTEKAAIRQWVRDLGRPYLGSVSGINYLLRRLAGESVCWADRRWALPTSSSRLKDCVIPCFTDSVAPWRFPVAWRGDNRTARGYRRIGAQRSLRRSGLTVG
jgi:hypothetical protein